MLGLDGTAALGGVTSLCNDFCFVFMSRANSFAFKKQSSWDHFPPGRALKCMLMVSPPKFTQENGKIRTVINSYP